MRRRRPGAPRGWPPPVPTKKYQPGIAGRQTLSAETLSTETLSTETMSTETMSTDTVLFDVAEGVATVTLNRPDRLNAFTAEMHGGLREAFGRATGH